MSKMPAISEIKSKILVSGKEAFDKYRRMTGGWGLGSAPESFLQNEIASALSFQNERDPALSSKKFCPYVSLEDTLGTVVSEYKKYNNADLDGRKIRGNKSGRFDIILWPNSGKQRIAVEVKKCWESDSCTKDAERLRKYVNVGVLKYGLIVAYMQAVDENKINERIKSVAKKTKTRVYQEYITGPEEIKDADGYKWYWAIACYQISKSS